MKERKSWKKRRSREAESKVDNEKDRAVLVTTMTEHRPSQTSLTVIDRCSYRSSTKSAANVKLKEITSLRCRNVAQCIPTAH